MQNMALSLYKEVYVESAWNVPSYSLIRLPEKGNPSLGKPFNRILETSKYDQAQKEHSINYVVLALHKLGLARLFEKSTPIPLAQLVELVSIQKKYVPLLRHMFQQLELEGFLSAVGLDTWRILAPFPDEMWLQTQVADYEQSMTATCPQQRFLCLWNNCCKVLPEILMGVVDPRDLVFPDADGNGERGGDSEGADLCYNEMPEVGWRNEALNAIVGSLRVSDRARILEISIGRTSEVTTQLLRLVGRQSSAVSYTLANPSNEHLRTIKEQLGSQPESLVLQTQPLNIELDPKRQGFVPKSFDLVVAINCLHTTKNIRVSLQHIQQLLKSGGLLILCERTQSTLGLDLTFGLLGDWWRFDRLERAYPLLKHGEWLRVLQEAGFEVNSAHANPESLFVAQIGTPRAPFLKTLSFDQSITYKVLPWLLLSNDWALRDGVKKLLGGGEGPADVHRRPVWTTCNMREREHTHTHNSRIHSSQQCQLDDGLNDVYGYSGIVVICKDEMGPLSELVSHWSSVGNVETKLVLVLISTKSEQREVSAHLLFDRMTPEVAGLLATLGRDKTRLSFTLIEYEKESTRAQEHGDDGLEFKIFKELWVQRGDKWVHRYIKEGMEFEPSFVPLDEDDIELESGNGHSEQLLSAIDYFVIQDEESAGDQSHEHITELLRETQPSRQHNFSFHCMRPETIEIIVHELCALHQRASHLRIIVTTSELADSSSRFPFLICFCEALVQYRRQEGGGRGAALIKVCGADRDDVLGMLERLPKAVYVKDRTITIVNSLGLEHGWAVDGEEGGVRFGDGMSPENSSVPLSPTHLSQLGSMRNSISVEKDRKSSLVSFLAGKSQPEQTSLVRDVVVESVLQVSGLSLADFEETQGFQDMGLDSVNVRDLAVRLSCAFGLDLQATSVFDHPTPQQLVAFIMDLISEEGVGRSTRRQSSYVLFDEDIAIVGASCRVAHANNLDEFWQLLADGVDCIRRVPSSRFDVDSYEDLIYNPYGSFVDDVAGFDCTFFQISPNEAALVDPQQRMLLQLTWEALEHAGIAPDTLEGSKTSVFVGLCNTDYRDVVAVKEGAAAGTYLVTSNLASVTAGRISYHLGLHGPCMLVDTACSSSLVAVDLACASLRAEECPLAIVGGVNLICSPDMYIKYCGAKMLSPGSVCRPFDDGADGMIRGEAGVVLILKRMTEALADGDNILAAIRGTGTNQDGASAGLTAPNGIAQAALIRRVLKKANAQASEIGYVEAHGTGTALGDPIEINALETIFGADRSTRGKIIEAGSRRKSSLVQTKLPLYIGSVKANVGHTEGAAGIVGLLKVCLALKYSRIPPQINVRTLNTQIVNPGFFSLPRRLTRWAGNYVGAVSSFGVSGTNAFAVVERPPDISRLSQQVLNHSSMTILTPFLFTISAKSSSTLNKLLASYKMQSSKSNEDGNLLPVQTPSHLSWANKAQLAAVAYTSNVGRSHHRVRAAILASDHSELADALTNNSFFLSPSGASGPPSQLCFLFTGQGSHYKGMGKELYTYSPYFRQMFEACVEAIDEQTPELQAMFKSERPAFTSRSILDVFGDDEGAEASLLADPVYSQLTIFSLEYSLARLWMRLGLTPTQLIGHSLGEYVAAAVAEVMPLEDALRLVQLRARLIEIRVQKGVSGMMAIPVSSSTQLQALLREFGNSTSENEVGISAINSNKQIVLSGPLHFLKTRATKAGSGHGFLLNIPYAFHSPQMKAIETEFRAQLLAVTFSKPKLNIVSTVTGKSVTEFNAEHWIRQLLGPVQFMPAVKHLAAELGCSVFVEVGPKPVLLPFCSDILRESGHLESSMLYHSMKQGVSSWSTLVHTIAQLYVLGFNFNFKEMYPHRLMKVDIPGYPFENIQCWSTRPSPTARPGEHTHKHGGQTPAREEFSTKLVHPLAGRELARTKMVVIWESTLDVGTFPYTYLQGHAFMGKIILPGAAFVEIALATSLGLQREDQKSQLVIKLKSLTIPLPLVLELGSPLRVQTILTPSTRGSGLIEINSCKFGEEEGAHTSDDWRTFANVEYEVKEQRTDEMSRSSIETLRGRLREEFDVGAVWKHFAETEGVEFGQSFQMIKRVWTGDGESLAEVKLALENKREEENYFIHPVLLDNAFQSVFTGLIFRGSELVKKPFMVANVGEVTLYSGKGRNHVFVHVTQLEAVEGSLTANIAIMNAENGEMCLEIHGFNARATTREQFERLTSNQLEAEGLYEEVWRERERWGNGQLDTGLLQQFNNTPLLGENPLYEELCLHYIAVSMETLGTRKHFDSAPQGRISTEKFCQLAGVLDIHGPLIQHFFRHLGLEEVGGVGTGEWSFPVAAKHRLSNLSSMSREAIKGHVLAARPGKALFGLVNICGEQLTPVLQGGSNPLELLFPAEESPNYKFSASEVYKESPGINQGNQTLEALLAKVLTKYVESSVVNYETGKKLELRICEIGAGTGSTSRHILKALRAKQNSDASGSKPGFRFDYTYTDISASFFIGAREEFGEEDECMTYRVLNIEEDPLGQGFVPFSYDLVVAANVLHATQNMQVTMRNARKLVRPHGLILILEATAPSLALDLTFGLLDGWWRFTGIDPIRPTYPLMSCRTWEKLLTDSSFTSIKYLDREESIIMANANDLQTYTQKMASHQLVSLKRDTGSEWLIIWMEDEPSELLQLVCALGIEYKGHKVGSGLLNVGVELGAVVLDSGKCEDVRLLSETVLNLVQALVNNGTRIHHKFVVRSKGAMGGGEKGPEKNKVNNPFGALLWGMCRTIRTEYPELKCVNIEVEADFQLVQEVYRTDEEGMVLCGTESRTVARLARLQSLRSSTEIEGPLFKSDRSYLITGGLGGLGPSMVRWMHGHGARHFVLLTRSRLTPKMSNDDLPQLSLKTVQCDISDRASLEDVMKACDPPLAGIFHLAGALSDAPTFSQSWETLLVTHGPKVFGTWNLHQLSLQLRLPLDYFVLFSSVASLVGTGGQVNHSSANAFMDAVAHFRNAASLPALSINWGVWAEIGSAQGRKLKKGLQGFSPKYGFSVLEKGLRSGKTQFAASLFDWSVYDTKGSSWYSEVAQRQSSPVLDDDEEGDGFEPMRRAKEAQRPSSTSKPSKAKISQNDAVVEGLPINSKQMQKVVVGVLKLLTGFTQIKLDSPFRTLGVDSLMMIEVRNRLQSLLKLTLPMPVLFDHPTVGALSEKLLEMVPKINGGSAAQNTKTEPTKSNTQPSRPFDDNPVTNVLNDTKTGGMGGSADQGNNYKSNVISTPATNKSEESIPTFANKLDQPTQRSNFSPLSADLNETERKLAETQNQTQTNGVDAVDGVDLSPSPTVRKDGGGNYRGDVAVVGIACRIGDTLSPEEFWKMLLDGRSAVRPVPDERSEVVGHFKDASGTVPHGSFIKHHDEFDNNFFHIGDREAELMDPQHRLLLQLSWHALENAGIPPTSLNGTRTGLFIGISGHDYTHILTRAESNNKSATPLVGFEFVNLLGNTACIAAGRISQLLGLHGPSMAIDTACSSSLVALHLGVQALRTGDADTVLVGGSNLLLSYDKFVAYERGGLLSSEGCTKSFDASASGFVRGEGVAVVVLKRAAEAHAQHALIKGSAVAHSGVGAGLGAPNGAAQVSLVQKALADARVDPAQVEYVEAQGSGSRVGDAVEINSFEQVFGGPTRVDRPLLLGTAKPNIGHCEASSGLASLIKVIMCMANKQIPPVTTLKILNPDIRNPTFFHIPREVTSWPNKGKRQLAGLASMGYGGTNAFAIVAREEEQKPSLDKSRRLPPPYLLPVSARAEAAMRKLMEAYHRLLLEMADGNPSLLASLAFSLTTTRTAHSEYRQAFLAESKIEFAQQLKNMMMVSSGLVLPIQDPPEPVSFQLSSGVDLPPELYETVPVFAKYRALIVQSAAPHGVRAEELLSRSKMNAYVGKVQVEVVREFCVQFILAAALIEIGIVPEEVSGTGIGDLVAAVLIGQVSLHEAWRLVKAAAGMRRHVLFLGKDSIQEDEDHVQRVDKKDVSPWTGYKNIVLRSDVDWAGIRKGDSAQVWADTNKCKGFNVQQTGVTISVYEDDGNSDRVRREHVIRNWGSLMKVLGTIWEQGLDLNLALLYDRLDYEKIDLPLYPFAPTRHWYN